MRSATLLGPALALLAAAGCSAFSSARPTEPAPRRVASSAATLGIPPGHLPPPGQCRIWVQGRPPGHQAPARSCDRIERSAPADSWVLYRPIEDKKVVHVRVLDHRRRGVVVRIRVYDAESGTLVQRG